MGMAGMGDMETTAFLLLPRFFDLVGLDFLNRVPNGVAQPLLVASLTISVVASYIAFLGHRRLYSLALTLPSSVFMYLSIYTWMSEPLYFFSLGGLMGGGIWGIFLGRKSKKLGGILS